MKSGNRPRAGKQRAYSFSSTKFNSVTEGDEQFFARHPNRSFRMRLLSRKEIRLIERAGSKLELPSAGMQWIAVVWQVLPDTRLKVICQAPIGMDTDAPEANCRALYFDLTSPKKIALSSNFEVLLQGTEKPSRDNRGGL